MYFEKFYKGLGESFDKGSINIVCLGDSVTHGCFESSIDMHNSCDFKEAYATKLLRNLNMLYPASIFNVINSGIGGETAEMAISRLDRDVFAYHPDLVIVSFGVNDFGNYDTYIRSLSTIFDRVHEKEIPCVYLTEHMMNTYSAEDTFPRWKEYSEVTAKAQTDGTMDKVFDGGIALAKEKGVRVCDMYHRWKSLYAHGADVTMLLANRINHPIRAMHDFTAFALVETILFDQL